MSSRRDARAKMRSDAKDFVRKTAPAAGGKQLAERHSYARLGQNASFTALPAVMHFGGYSVNVVHTQKLSITNKSLSSKRMHIIAPTTPYFRAKFENKGWVAPGMSTELTIEFAPTEWRYYYDCVRVHADKENLLVPIHAYPVMNDVVFPKIVDFGLCALTETSTRVVELKCKVPIQFEYELTVVEPHSDFKIFPLKGIVPPNGVTPITIEFTPLKLVSARMEIEVNISQFGFKPFRCKIAGSSAAGLTREQALAQAQARVVETDEDPALGASLTDYNPSIKLRTKGVGSGGVDDPGLTALERKHAEKRERVRRRTEKLSKMGRKPPLPPTKGVPATELEEKVEGVRVPLNLDKPSAVNFILTQQKGKLKPKDLAAAVEQQNAQRAKQQSAQAKLKAMQGTAARDAPGPGLTISAMEAEERGGGADMDDEDGPPKVVEEDGPPDEDVRRLREMVFLQDVNDIDKAERTREFQSAREWLGEDDTTREQVQAVQDTRMKVRNAEAITKRQAARQQATTVAKGPHAVIPVRVTVYAHERPAVQPTFNTYKNNEWAKRKQVIMNLRNIVTRDVVRRRAAERLAALRKRISEVAGEGKEAIRDLVEKDNRMAATAGAAQSAGKGDDDGGWLKGFDMRPHRIQRVAFPEVPEVADAQLGADARVAVDTPRDFNELTLFRLTEPPEQEIMAYEPFDLPVAPVYIPRESDRVFREGAAEESSVRAFDPMMDRRLAEATTTVDLELPARVSTAPPPVASLAPLLPDPGIRPLLELEAITEASPDYILQADLAVPFSLAPARLPSPFDEEEDTMIDGGDAAGEGEGATKESNQLAHGAADLNGLVPTRSQVESTTLGTQSLRSVLPMQTLSDVWQPRRERPDADLLSAWIWQPPRMPEPLQKALSEDELSDDSESDDDEAKANEAMPLTMEYAASMFADKSSGEEEEEDAPEDTKGEDAKEGGDDEEADVAPATAIPRDRALLALAAKQRNENIEWSSWLDKRMRLLDATIVNPKHRFAFEAW